MEVQVRYDLVSEAFASLPVLEQKLLLQNTNLESLAGLEPAHLPQNTITNHSLFLCGKRSDLSGIAHQ